MHPKHPCIVKLSRSEHHFLEQKLRIYFLIKELKSTEGLSNEEELVIFPQAFALHDKNEISDFIIMISTHVCSRSRGTEGE